MRCRPANRKPVIKIYCSLMRHDMGGWIKISRAARAESSIMTILLQFDGLMMNRSN
jgi:hypothetical protein